MKKRIAAVVLAASMLFSINGFAADSRFSDVPETHWANEYIQRASQAGWINGAGDNQFAPLQTITSQEFLSAVIRTCFSSSITPEQSASLLSGTSLADKENLEKKITRYDMAQILWNTASLFGRQPDETKKTQVKAYLNDWENIPENYRDGILSVYALEIMRGTSPVKGNFSGDSTVTRADTAAILCRIFDLITGADSVQDASFNAEKNLYRVLEEGMQNIVGITYQDGDFKNEAYNDYIDLTSFGLSNRTAGEGRAMLSNVFVNVFYDHPEFFYIDQGFYRKVDKNGIIVGIAPRYYDFVKSGNLEKCREELEEAIEEALAQVEGVTDPVDKMLIIYDYLSSEYVYNWEVANGQIDAAPRYAWSPYSLTKNDTVCKGIALAFHMIMNRLEIPCVTVPGNSKRNSHVWNMVQVDNQWYHLDANKALSAPALRGRSYHKGFLFSDKTANEFYARWYEERPVCTSDKYDSGWAFKNSNYPTCWKDGAFYYLLRNKKKEDVLYYGKLSEQGTAVTTLPLYQPSGIVWQEQKLYYVNTDKKLVCYDPSSKEQVVLGEIPFTPVKLSGIFEKKEDGIGLSFDRKTKEIVASSRNQREEIKRFPLQ